MTTNTSDQNIGFVDRRRDRRSTRHGQVAPYAVGDYFGVIRRRWIYLTLMPVALFIAAYIAFTLPPMYRSSGTILLEEASVPQDFVRTTVTSYANRQIELVQRRVMTTDSLALLVQDFDPYPDSPEFSDRDKARLVRENTEIEKVDPITLETLAESSAFSIHYYNPDPMITAEVANRLVALFLDYNRAARTERAADTYRFLEEQSRDAEEHVTQLEQRLADFKTEFGDAIPEAQARNLAALDRTQRDLDALQSQIRVVGERQALLDLQLSDVSPSLFSTGGGWQAELALLRADLAEARQRYTEDHPDVRRLRRSIAALSERAEAMPDSQREVPPDNPEYMRLASQLETVREELGALQASANRARAQIRLYETRLVMAPDVERDYRQLSREHDIAQNRFREIQNKLGEAALAQTLESTDQGARFSLIRSPGRPSAPDSPNRTGIILLGFVLGVALSGGMISLKESTDPSIRSTRDLSEITDITPIGAVPYMLNRADRRRRVVALSAAVVGAALALVILSSTMA